MPLQNRDERNVALFRLMYGGVGFAVLAGFLHFYFHTHWSVVAIVGAPAIPFIGIPLFLSLYPPTLCDHRWTTEFCDVRDRGARKLGEMGYVRDICSNPGCKSVRA